MYKISIYGCAMFKKLVRQWVKLNEARKWIKEITESIHFTKFVPCMNRSYSSTSSTCPHGVDTETLHFTSHSHQEECDFRVFPGLWCVGEQPAVRPVAEGRAEVKGIIRNWAQSLARQRQAYCWNVGTPVPVHTALSPRLYTHHD